MAHLDSQQVYCQAIFMKFDIIIPIYNIQKELRTCLESISRQSYGDFRAIMVDDGSTDQSPFIARSYAAGDSDRKSVV